jgi:predicted small integral membrane protein
MTIWGAVCNRPHAFDPSSRGLRLPSRGGAIARGSRKILAGESVAQAESGRLFGGPRVPVVRAVKILMVAVLALWAGLAAFDNIVDYEANFQFVRHVLSMDGTFPGSVLRWRALVAPWTWHAAYALIIAMEAASSAAFAAGALAMVRARKAPAPAFAAAASWCTAGIGIGFALWCAGFMVVGGEWFAMWQSPQWNGQQAAFRFYTSFLLVGLFVNLPEPGAGAA